MAYLKLFDTILDHAFCIMTYQVESSHTFIEGIKTFKFSNNPS
jgi:hypothetical protein